MPRCCVVVGCNTEAGEGYSFLLMIHKLARNGCELYSRNGATGQGQKPALLCFLKSTLHLSASWKAGAMEIPLVFLTRSSGAIPTIFPKFINDDNRTSPPPPKRPVSERRRLIKSVSDQRYFIIYTTCWLERKKTSTYIISYILILLMRLILLNIFSWVYHY